ncbi:DNA-binding domain-containing protein [Otariodibacter oris]|uniref:Uncharacterized protein n=1 Tax=Otariodibacter oris TaxID=1032623 RepID=A0A420XIN6_9PAST|nr:putative DNA-binding domain-containing protein [Otariodibacter oris]QGM80616.1 hypothetical protein A6A10_03965 [Otariodibacter oris]RKR77227.1 hypothetical protein DES31_0552 [Otariodibacter oris]
MSLKMIKKEEPTLAEIQQTLVNTVRTKTVVPEFEDKVQRLKVYMRLVRNNTFGFVDRCFTETQKHFSEDDWLQIKERFVQEGKAQSPYFQDIAGEFLLFCQNEKCVDDNLLHLMDFEYTQLLAEVSMDNVAKTGEWNEKTIMQLSPIVYLKEYPVDFLSHHFAEFIDNSHQVVIWRDSQFDVYYHSLSELDYWLLSYLKEQPDSLNQVIDNLAEIVGSNIQAIELLKEIWKKWVDVGVIV